MRDVPALYEIARQINHEFGFPWKDPRTGKTHQPPKKRAVKKTTKRKGKK